jgi:hypothetical protein
MTDSDVGLDTRATVPRRMVAWLRRYLPLEVAGTAATLLGAHLTYRQTGSLAAAAIAGTVAESVGYYGLAAARSWTTWHRASPRSARRRRLAMFWCVLRATVLEFGLAEIADVGVRTVLLYLLPSVLNDTTSGWLVGKLLADIVFYAVAILSFERHRKLIVPVRLHPQGDA